MIASFRSYYRPVFTVSQAKPKYVDRQTIIRGNCPLNNVSAEAQKCRDSHRGIPESRLQLRIATLGSITVSVPSDKALPVNLSKITEPGLLEVMRPLRVVAATMSGVTLTRLYSVLVTLMKSGL